MPYPLPRPAGADWKRPGGRAAFFQKGARLMKAWIFQDDKQVKKHGEAAASWYVGWIDPDGNRCCKSCGPGADGKRSAEKLRKKTEAELLTGTYQSHDNKTWEEFRREYETKVVEGLAVRTRAQVKTSLAHFERIVRPKKMSALKTQAVDSFIAVRRRERGQKAGSLVSPATINHDLRHVKAALSVAGEWGYLAKVPKFRMEREPKKLPIYVTPEHFAAVYQACDKARMPEGQPFPPADWWRALVVMAYMTGWRIGDLLGFRREDLDLETATAITRFEDNKGKRDERVKLHPVVVEHLKKLPGFDPHVFPWNHNRRTLHTEFARIQEAAGIHLPCRGNHGHTRFCHVYGFHDLRRAFATMNADRLTADALQSLMRHKSYQTTQRYINLARQMDEAVAVLHVPEVLRGAAQ
jgi:integrase